jgi:hypothetical protein
MVSKGCLKAVPPSSMCNSYVDVYYVGCNSYELDHHGILTECSHGYLPDES